ncbi:phosphatidylglycerol lysyltransferase domain-containing protein [Bacillus solimangrovi]|uniref:Phosphatidylglycerol lysyltransferase C-terminal domain-containing protein n=1 Tax=Bacillus solimangrovi TaxID=1305675 RepID=A0A1E5LJQ6_9BACI|nr:phosphatidylglycerol lysyltransferase domain-containing protein [Bacillus solimangrovi]OEH94314.1 hypothetical protein BFG57_08645 [Bacillus solimangrovi]
MVGFMLVIYSPLFYVLLAFVMMLGCMGFVMMRKGHNQVEEEINCDELMLFLKQYGNQTNTHLFFLQDKKIYWTEERDACVVYRRIWNKLVVLGDPIGKEEALPKIVYEFQVFAEREKCVPIFYQVNREYMDMYHQVGFRFVKLGEEGYVNLSDFSLTGKKGAKLRTSKNKLERLGYQFQVLEPPYTNAFLLEMKEVSDSWLNNRKEKGFSVGSFDNTYVSLFPVAIIQNSQGKLIAFATLAGQQNADNVIGIDLMRSVEASPNGTMDVLFASIFQWSKENGYSSCSLGFSPLAGVGEYKYARKYERLARYIYLHGHFLYKFRGLREYKGKFAHDWEPKYLAYKRSSFFITMMQIILLIHSKSKHLNKRIPLYTQLKRRIG